MKVLIYHGRGVSSLRERKSLGHVLSSEDGLVLGEKGEPRTRRTGSGLDSEVGE